MPTIVLSLVGIHSTSRDRQVDRQTGLSGSVRCLKRLNLQVMTDKQTQVDRYSVKIH